MTTPTPEEKKKSFTDKLTEFFKEPEKKDHMETRLSDLGVTVATDTKLQSRIALLEKLFDYINTEIQTTDPKEYLQEIKKKLDNLNTVISTVAGPYARAGNNPRYQRLMRGWSSWYALASSWILRSFDYFLEQEADPVEYGQLNAKSPIKSLYNAFTLHVFKDAYLALAYCFFDKDVSPQTVTVIQTFQQNKAQLPYGQGPGH